VNIVARHLITHLKHAKFKVKRRYVEITSICAFARPFKGCSSYTAPIGTTSTTLFNPSDFAISNNITLIHKENHIWVYKCVWIDMCVEIQMIEKLLLP